MNLEKSLSAKAWEKVGIGHHHGINIPLASIHTQNSCGIGEFLDLIPLINYCASLKLDVLQLLPLNDSGLDPSPYNALSATALHPIYLSLSKLPHLSEKLKEELKSFKELNHSKNILYEQVADQKYKWLRKYVHLAGPKIVKTPQYQTFVDQNEWLNDYSLFKVLKEKNRNEPWGNWEEKERSPSKGEKSKLCHMYSEEISFYNIIQYLCSSQLKSVKKHAEKHGVFLKGDIPILLSPNSADVWAHREFFDLTLMAGSPPTSFDPNGQLWKFPLYNWKAMEENHFEWWRRRIKYAAEYFHIYRIDHILGFFRIWAIPHGQPPEKGFFIPNNEELMKSQGRKILETLIGFSDMLPIGEDIGDPPTFALKCMEELGIPSTKIFRLCRNWKTDRTFIPVNTYSPITISSVSTHDFETVRHWWKKKRDEAADYAVFKKWTYSSEISLEKQFEILWDSHHSKSYFHVNLLQEYLALIPELTWEDPQDEQINIPGTELKRNWSYRYKMPLETLLHNEKLRTLFLKLLREM